MIGLIRLHWLHIRQPDISYIKIYSKLPPSLGVLLSALYLSLFYFSDARTIATFYKIASISFPDILLQLVIFLMLSNIAYNLLFKWAVFPKIVSHFSGNIPLKVDPTTYRSIAFFAPTAFVIFSTLIVLPLKIALAFIINHHFPQIYFWIFTSLVFLAGLWEFILVIATIKFEWINVRRQCHLTGQQTLLVVIILPLIIGILPNVVFMKSLITYFESIG
jgi:hypothetical protein